MKVDVFMVNDNVDKINRPYPYMSFKISSGALKYPVMGLFVNEEVVVDIIWENFISLLEYDDSVFSAKKVSFHNECGRDVVIKFKPEKGSFSFYVGHRGKELDAPSEAEYYGDINSLDVGLEAQRFSSYAEDWINKQIK